MLVDRLGAPEVRYLLKEESKFEGVFKPARLLCKRSWLPMESGRIVVTWTRDGEE